MNNIHENDYDYKAEYQDYHAEKEDMEEDEDNFYYDEDDFMDQDIYSDDDFAPDLTPTDYVYFTLPEQDETILPSVLEGLKGTGNIVNSGQIKQLRIKNSDIEKYVFNPVVEQVIRLINKQIYKSHTKIETLFLLGGFGQSPYLYKKLHYEFITGCNSIIQLVVPEDGYRASMRGGIYHGIDCIGIIPKNHVKETDQVGFFYTHIYNKKYKTLVAIGKRKPP